jgi:DNA-binding CsgD family transcriptional regulator
VADDEGLIPEKELHATRFYQEVLKPMDVAHGMALCLNTNAEGQVMALTINRRHRAGYYTPEERQLAWAILPHVRNFYCLHQHMSWLNTEAQCFRGALDKLRDGVYLLGKNGCVLFANEQAQGLESKATCLCRKQRTLAAVNPKDELALRAALMRIATEGSANSNESLGLHDAAGWLVATITLCPAPRLGSNLWSESKVVAMAFVRTLGSCTAPSYDLLHNLLKLTVAETRLAALLMQGNTLDQAAALLCVSRNTLRTQLQGIFAKTDTHRQSDLLRVLLRLS